MLAWLLKMIRSRAPSLVYGKASSYFGSSRSRSSSSPRAQPPTLAIARSNVIYSKPISRSSSCISGPFRTTSRRGGNPYRLGLECSLTSPPRRTEKGPGRQVTPSGGCRGTRSESSSLRYVLMQKAVIRSRLFFVCAHKQLQHVDAPQGSNLWRGCRHDEMIHKGQLNISSVAVIAL